MMNDLCAKIIYLKIVRVCEVCSIKRQKPSFATLIFDLLKQGFMV